MYPKDLGEVMENGTNVGYRYNPSVAGSSEYSKLKIPVSSIYRLKGSFYKHLEVDEVTREAIRLYNYVKQGKCE